MRTAFAVAALALIILLAVTALADVPAKVNYQVMVTDDSNEPLVDQSVTLFFVLYDQLTGGMILWSESHDATTNSIGVASVALGSNSPLTPFHFQTPTWLSVSVNGQLMSPRREMVSAPYALHSSDSDQLGALPAEYYTLGEDLWTPGTINTPSNPVDWTMLKNVPAGFADGGDAEGGAGDGHSLDADDGSPVDAVYVDADGTVEFGSSTSDGAAEFYASGAASPSIKLSAEPTYGGLIELYEEGGAQYGGLEPDFDGTGGFLWLDNGSGGSGFYVDGNAVSGDAQVGIYGTASSTYFNTYNTSDDAVQLPASAVSAPEILDEAGAARIATATTVDLTGPVQSILLRTIIVPAPGYVLVMATLEPRAVHSGGIASSASFGVSSSSTAFPYAGAMAVRIPETEETGIWFTSLTVQGLFEVDVAGGAYTFHLLAEEAVGSWTIFDRNMTLVYLPTSYGLSANAGAAHPTDQERGAAMPGRALTDADIAAERAESEAFNNARIERELAEMEAKIAEIRASMGNRNKR